MSGTAIPGSYKLKVKFAGLANLQRKHKHERKEMDLYSRVDQKGEDNAAPLFERGVHENTNGESMGERVRQKSSRNNRLEA